MADFAEFGSTPRGGVCRLAGSDADREARDFLAARFRVDLGVEPIIDGIGNMLGIDKTAPGAETVVLAGSHLDSQVTGGRFDGTYGVAAAMTAVRALLRNAHGISFRHNIAVANWTNEEGARFQPSLLGSSVFAGKITMIDALRIRDDAGCSVAEALDRIGYLGRGRMSLRPVRALELHIEQGDVLERAGRLVAVVDGAWAARKTTLEFIGEAAHTGPTPNRRRRDALRAAARCITEFHELCGGESEIHSSAASIRVFPNSPNVIPSLAAVTFEIRMREAPACNDLGDRFIAAASELCLPLGVELKVAGDNLRPPVGLCPDGVKFAKSAAADLGMRLPVMKTVAGHDALALQHSVPSTLLFVQTRDGLSHNEAEDASPESVRAGLKVFYQTLRGFVA
jgi:N-carbamoyl-L-amino-acid hydrolase